MTRPVRSPVAVVGGGVTGAFAAYYLARMNVPVTLIERGEIGVAASGNNPGGLNPLYGPGIPGPLSSLAMESFSLHEEFAQARGGQLKRKQRLNLALDDTDLRYLEDMFSRYEEAGGFGARWLEPDVLAAHQPRLNPGFRAGMVGKGDGKVEPRGFTRAVVSAAEAEGATVVRGEVTGVRSSGDEVVEVTLDGGALPCSGVVLATGAYCTEPSVWLEVPLPIEPVRGEMMLVEIEGPMPPVELAWRDAALYPAGGSTAWLGGTETASFDDSPSASGRQEILDKVAAMVPGAAVGRIVRRTAGLRPVTPGGLPIVGLAPGWANVCLALGGGRKGMLLGAGMGRAAADLMVHGDTALDISGCSPLRFATESSRP